MKFSSLIFVRVGCCGEYEQAVVGDVIVRRSGELYTVFRMVDGFAQVEPNLSEAGVEAYFNT